MERYIEMGGMYIIGGEKHFGRKVYVQPNRIAEIRKKFNNTDVYSTLFTYDNSNQEESNLFGPLYLDLDMKFDNEEEYKKLKFDLNLIITSLWEDYKIPKEYINLYFSGNKGFHIIISPTVFNIKADKKLNMYYKAIAEDLNKSTINKIIDTRIYDCKRLIRLPNSINAKSGLYKVPITYKDAITFTFEEMKEYASEKRNLKLNIGKYVKQAEEKLNNFKQEIEAIDKKRREKRKMNVDISEVKLSPCISNILINGAMEGQRNNTAVILASSLFQAGVCYEQTEQILIEWNDATNVPSLNSNELIATIKSAHQMYLKDKFYGCSAINDMGLCLESECNIYNKRR